MGAFEGTSSAIWLLSNHYCLNLHILLYGVFSETSIPFAYSAVHVRTGVSNFCKLNTNTAKHQFFVTVKVQPLKFFKPRLLKIVILCDVS